MTPVTFVESTRIETAKTSAARRVRGRDRRSRRIPERGDDAARIRESPGDAGERVSENVNLIEDGCDALIQDHPCRPYGAVS